MTAAVAGLAVAALTSCGSASAQPTPAAPSVKADHLMVAAGDLPDGWRDSNSQGTDYRVSVCGVDIEPAPPLDAANRRFSRSALGPFLEQHVRVYKDDTAAQVIKALQAALPTCPQTTVPRTTGSKETIQVAIEPITVEGAGPQAVAWRQRTMTARPIVSEVVLTRVGRSAVLFTSYALRPPLDPQVLVDAVAATRRKG